jgi:hypothetical protein
MRSRCGLEGRAPDAPAWSPYCLAPGFAQLAKTPIDSNLACLKILRSLRDLVFPAGLLLNSALSAFSETVSIRPTADTTLFESSPNDNMGGWTHVAAGTTGNAADRTRNRGLFRFDIATVLPPGARITNATLNLEVVRIPGTMGGGSSVSSTFALHRVLRPWGEGDKLGDRGFPADPGEATWNYRLAPNLNGTGGAPWAVAGGSSATDFSATVSASQAVAGIRKYQFGSNFNLVDDVQTWLDNPSSNFGWMLISRSENSAKTARAFGSREDADHAPMLTIEYSAPVPLKIENAEQINQVFRFTFNAEPGHPYVVQARNSLSSESWQAFTNFSAPANFTNIVVEDLISFPQRFYRVGKF